MKKRVLTIGYIWKDKMGKRCRRRWGPGCCWNCYPYS